MLTILNSSLFLQYLSKGLKSLAKAQLVMMCAKLNGSEAAKYKGMAAKPKPNKPKPMTLPAKFMTTS